MSIHRTLLLAAATLSASFLLSCQSPISPQQSAVSDSGSSNTSPPVSTATAYPMQPTLAAVPTPTPYPTLTPHPEQPTFTPAPTYTLLPSSTPYPDSTAYPEQPTLVPQPTPTLYPTSTVYPTLGPDPTYTPYPTNTPRPTYTPLPTSTPYPTPIVPGGRTVTVGKLDKHPTEFWLDLQTTLLVGCRTNMRPVTKAGKSDYTFSSDGKFESSRFLAYVSGFSISNPPLQGVCYEMVVKYQGQERFCYWVETTYRFVPPTLRLPFESDYCRGWRQVTPKFKLASADSAHRISKHSDRWKTLYSQ